MWAAADQDETCCFRTRGSAAAVADQSHTSLVSANLRRTRRRRQRVSSPGMGLTSLSAVLVAAAASLGSPRSPSLASALTPVLVPRGHLITANPTHAPTIDPDRSNDAVSGDDAPTAAPTVHGADSGRSPYDLTTFVAGKDWGDILTNNPATVATKGGKNAQDRPNGRPRKDNTPVSEDEIKSLHEIDARKAYMQDDDVIEGYSDSDDEEVTVNFTGDRNKGNSPMAPLTDLPTISPTTMFPTTSPTQAPTLLSQQLHLELEFKFDDLNLLQGPSLIVWEDVTADHMSSRLGVLDNNIQWPAVSTRIRRQTQSNGVDDDTASSAITNQGPVGRANEAPLSQAAGESSGENRRRLGSSAWFRRLQRVVGRNPLGIVSVSIISFKSVEEYDMVELAKMVGEVFNSEEDRALYIKSLKDSKEESFLGISSVVVKINGEYVPGDLNTRTDSVEEDTSTSAPILWAGAAAALVVVVLFAVAAYVYIRQNARKKAFLAATYGRKVSKTIDVDNGDDVSTLGDPVFSSGTMLASGDRTIVSTDYEYAKQYGRNDAPTAASPKSYEADRSITSGSRITMATAANGIRKMDASLFSDDASFEKQYCDQEQNIEVHAPAGKLGVVIDTPVGGSPIVHAIKDSSVLAGKVRVGDRLLSVDDIDVTPFSSVEVSRLISSRAHQPSRVLLFLRQVVVE